MITSKEAEILIGKTIVFPGRERISSDEIPQECRKYLCMRNTEETASRMSEAMMSCDSLAKLTEEARTLSHEEAVHLVLVLADRLTNPEPLSTEDAA